MATATATAAAMGMAMSHMFEQVVIEQRAYMSTTIPQCRDPGRWSARLAWPWTLNSWHLQHAPVRKSLYIRTMGLMGREI